MFMKGKSMNTTDLGRLLHEEADAASFSLPDPAAIIAAARRRRHRRLGVGVGAAGLAIAGATIGIIAAASAPTGRATLVPVSSPGTTPEPSATPSSHPSPIAAFAPIKPAAWTPLSPMPGTILAAVGAGAEKPAILSAGDGHVIRVLPNNGSQASLWRYGSMLLQPTIGPVECRNNYDVVNTTTGAVTPPPAELPGMDELATGSTPQRIAYGEHQAAGKHQEIVYGRHVTILGGCGASPVDLYVADPADGKVRRWIGNNPNGLYPSLNAHGLQVAFVLDGHIHLLDVNGPEKTLQQSPILATPADCTVTDLQYQPGSDTLLWVAQTCPSGTYLTGYDTQRRREKTTIQVAAAGAEVNITSFDVSADGHLVGTLVSFTGSSGDSRVFTVDGTAVRQLPEASSVYQVLW
jgi:hypothetical protein